MERMPDDFKKRAKICLLGNLVLQNNVPMYIAYSGYNSPLFIKNVSRIIRDALFFEREESTELKRIQRQNKKKIFFGVLEELKTN